MNEKPIEAEVISQPQSQALTVRPSQEVAPAGLFGTQEPVAIIEKATSVATALKAVIVRQGLISRISGKDYPKCEAWTLLGTMLGVFPVLCWSRQVDDGWEARVEARTRDGAIVGAAEAECLRSEKNWSNRDDFALRSMAQTRATAKCLRMPLGFVMTLAGYEATPAEEMVSDHPQRPGKAPGAPAAASQPQSTSRPAAAPAAPAQPLKQDRPAPTEEWRKTTMNRLQANPGGANHDSVQEYFRKLSDPTPLMPNEPLEALELRFIPGSAKELMDLVQKWEEFARGDRAAHAFPPHYGPLEPTPAGTTTPAQVLPKVLDEAKAKAADPEWWRDIIIPVPPKGMKRAEYLKKPETIGQLFDMRHGSDDQSQAARQRLWGFVNHYEPQKWTKRDGTVMPPSDADVKFRDALDAFNDWFEKNHPGEKL